jgi:iron complex transport system ATP-binding protein
MEPILTLTDVCCGYGQTPVLDKINLQIGAAEILGVLGRNGSGKSTLLKVMDGILMPQAGEVLVKGKPLPKVSRLELAREVALVAQETHFRFPFSVTEVVLMGRFPHLKTLQFEGERDMAVAFDAMKATHCLELAGRSIHELSGGERQRVLIARALAQEPQVILLDEPTSFLDLKFKREIFQLIEFLSKDKGLSVVMVSHDIDLTAQYCRRVMMLNNGSIHEMGEPDQVITSANIESVYDCPVLVDKNPATGKPRVSLF